MTTPIRLATSRERPAPKLCALCAYKKGRDPSFYLCKATGHFCNIERMQRFDPISACGSTGLLWEARPPRRSLARWIYDTFLKIGDAR